MAFNGKRGVDMSIDGKPDKNTQRTEPTEDEEIIELKDEIDGGQEDDDEILDLLDAVEEFPIKDQNNIAFTETEKPVGDEGILELTDEIIETSQDDDFVDSLGIELGTGEDIPEGSLEGDRVSDEQIEAALERVIKKLFYEKIDGILIEVIEKTVKKEIERLKNILVEEESGSKK